MHSLVLRILCLMACLPLLWGCSFDPLALDQACADLCNAATPLRNSQVGDNMSRPGFVDYKDIFKNNRPTIDWKSCLEHAEKIGLGSRDYELVRL